MIECSVVSRSPLLEYLVNGPHLLLLAANGGLFDGYSGEIIQALLALLGVCALAVWAIRLTASRFPRLSLAQGPVRVVQRVVLEPRRALYLVRVGPRLLLLGAGESYGPVLLAELDPQILPDGTAEIPGHAKPMTERLNRWIGRSQHGRNAS